MTPPMLKPALKIGAFVASCILYACTIFAAYGGRFNTDIFTFPAVMTLLLPWFATATLVITILWFCFRKYIPGAIGVVAILCSWGPISTVSPLGHSMKATPGAQTFTIMTYNIIHGWDQEHKNAKRNRTIDYIMETDPDIVCLQEVKKLTTTGDVTNFTPEQQAELKKKYPYEVGDPNLDMKLLSKYPAVFEKGYSYIYDDYDNRRYTFYKININGHHLLVINVHLMSFLLSEKERKIVTGIHSIEDARESVVEFKGMRQKFHRGFKKRKKDVDILRKTIDKLKGNIIICGDFNDVPESYAYRLLRGTDLKDAYVETGFGPLVTYNQHAFWFHLDQMLYRGDLKALNIRKGKTKVSDHYPVIAEFEFTN